MTFKELQKIIHYRQSQSNSDQTRFFNRLKDKPFWIWNVAEHKAEDRRTKGDCCFQHIIGLPVKGEVERPLYPYQKIVYDALDKHKHVWIKKSTGLGITEFMLRYMAWLCLKDKTLAGSQMCVVTGPRIDLAITLIDRMKRLFEPKAGIYFDTKETVIELNGVTIEAYPSHHLDAMRGLANVSFILNDESDFYPPGQQQDARDVSERYIAKSNPYIVMVSTPNKPGGLFEQIELEPAERCLYKRLYLDYTYGLGKIYSEEEITNAMASPSFQREYCLKYGGHTGNVFSEPSIQSALFKGERIPLTATGNLHSRKVCAVDPGFGSSACGICVCQLIDYKIDPKTNAVTSYSDNGSYTGNVVQVLYAEEFERANFEAMIAVTVNLMKKYGIYSDPEGKVYVDGSASAFVRSLKIAIGEDPNYEGAIERAKKSGLKHPWWLGKVEPIMFGTGGAHKAMLGHAKMMMDKGFVAIHPSFTKLIIAIRTAYENEGSLDKERSSHTDVFDAFRMALKFFELASGGSSSSYLGR